jgi:hypothetical protein
VYVVCLILNNILEKSKDDDEYDERKDECLELSRWNFIDYLDGFQTIDNGSIFLCDFIF